MQLSLLLTGALTGFSLIVAIGAQNAFVLRQGLRRDRVLLVVAICALSDAILIFAGVAGIGALVKRAPIAIDVVRWLGVAFLTAYGLTSIWRARRAQALRAAPDEQSSRASILGKTLALTWLNPHVYLDTVLLLGSIAATHGSGGRWWFGVGAALASVIWFTALGYGARRANAILGSPRAWQILDVAIGMTMLAIAYGLARG